MTGRFNPEKYRKEAERDNIELLFFMLYESLPEISDSKITNTKHKILMSRYVNN